jgi:hypothetical protein
MIIEETFYAIECDVCKAQAENYDGHCFWADRSQTEENAMECEWHKEGDYHYCPDCHSFNNEDELVIKVLPIQAGGV